MKGGWLVPGTVQGVEVEFLVDSGSDVTLVDSRFYDSIPAYARPHLDPRGCCLPTASGSPMAPVGEAHLKLGFGGPELVLSIYCFRIGIHKGNNWK